MTQQIPISFDHNGSHFEGHFNEMTSGSTWHLMINNYYYGQLLHSQTYGHQFYSNKGHFEDLSDFFGKHIEQWYEKNPRPR